MKFQETNHVLMTEVALRIEGKGRVSRNSDGIIAFP